MNLRKIKQLLTEKPYLEGEVIKPILYVFMRFSDTTEETPKFIWGSNNDTRPKTISYAGISYSNDERNIGQNESDYLEYLPSQGFIIEKREKDNSAQDWGLINYREYRAYVPVGSIINVFFNKGFYVKYKDFEMELTNEDFESSIKLNDDISDIKINKDKECWAKEEFNKTIKRYDGDFNKNRGFELVELSKDIYEENLKSYADVYIDFLMSDDHFWYEGAPESEEERAKEIYNFLFDPILLWDGEDGIKNNDEFVEMIDDAIYSSPEIENGDEEDENNEKDFVKELLWILHLIDLQERFLNRYGEFIS